MNTNEDCNNVFFAQYGTMNTFMSDPSFFGYNQLQNMPDPLNQFQYTEMSFPEIAQYSVPSDDIVASALAKLNSEELGKGEEAPLYSGILGKKVMEKFEIPTFSN